MKDYKNIIENTVRSYGVPEWVEDFDISCEGYIEGVVSWLTGWDWEEHFGVPEGIDNFINTHKAKEFCETITRQCYEIILLTLERHYLVIGEEKVANDRKGKTDAGYIVDVLNGLVASDVWYGSWTERVAKDGWKDLYCEWTPVGMFMQNYLKKGYKDAKRGSVKWKELEEAGLVEFDFIASLDEDD